MSRMLAAIKIVEEQRKASFIGAAAITSPQYYLCTSKVITIAVLQIWYHCMKSTRRLLPIAQFVLVLSSTNTRMM